MDYKGSGDRISGFSRMEALRYDDWGGERDNSALGLKCWMRIDNIRAIVRGISGKN
jgi:hypothetical protein